jgi:hypothetical protein
MVNLVKCVKNICQQHNCESSQRSLSFKLGLRKRVNLVK